MTEIIQAGGKGRLRRYLVTAMLAALAATGGLFAYAYTSSTGTIAATSKSADFAQVTDNVSAGTSFNVFGSYRGSIGAGTLFEVTPATDYQGDLEVNVYLSNADQLSYKYGLLLMRITFVDSGDSAVDVEGIAKPLTLQNGVVSFIADNLTAGTTYYIKTTGGLYRSFPWAYLNGSGGSYSPQISAEVVQAGL